MTRKFTRLIKTTQSKYKAIIEKKEITQQCSYNLELEMEEYLLSIDALIRITPEGNDTNVLYELKSDYKVILGTNIIAIIGEKYKNLVNKVIFTHTEGSDGSSKKIQLKKTDFDAKKQESYNWFVDLYNKNIENILFISIVDNDNKTITFDLELSEHLFSNPRPSWQEMNYTIDELANILIEMTKQYDKVLGIHLFGIRYGAYIRNKRINVRDINSKANIGDFVAELHKGVKLSAYVVEESCDLERTRDVEDDYLSVENPTYWICAANVKFFDHVGAFELNGMIDWAQDKHFSKAKIGDIVFLYSSRPEKKVKYKCVISKKDIKKEDHIDDTEFWADPVVNDKYQGLYIRFELVKESNDERLSLSNLMTKGLKGAPQGAYKLDDERLPIAHYIDDVFEGKSTIDESKRLKTGYNTILYGVPGAGKSWTIENEYCVGCGGKERLVFHPDYTYADFVGQILPKVDIETGEVTYKFVAGPFTKIVKEAYENPDKEYFLIIEEINRGNAPAIFGDVFQLLDRDSNGQSAYGITHADMARIIYGDENHEIRVPSNMSILATMNTSDQNVFTLDTAFQRRWHMRLIENVFKKDESEDVTKFAETKIMDTTVTWETFCTKLNEIILNRNVGMTSAEDKRLGTHFITAGDLVYIPNPSTMKDHIQNSRFAEKVIKYLWDDAFKFSRDEIFNPANNSLEKVIKSFMQAQANERFNIFVENIKNDLLVILENSKKDSE